MDRATERVQATVGKPSENSMRKGEFCNTCVSLYANSRVLTGGSWAQQQADRLNLFSARIQLLCALPTGRWAEDGGAELVYYWPSVRHESDYWLSDVRRSWQPELVRLCPLYCYSLSGRVLGLSIRHGPVWDSDGIIKLDKNITVLWHCCKICSFTTSGLKKTN